MSIRAYRIKKIEYDTDATFNLGYNEFIWNNLVPTDDLNMDGVGIIEMAEENIRGVITDFDDLWAKYDNPAQDDDTTKEQYLKMLNEMADSCEDGYVQYYCF